MIYVKSEDRTDYTVKDSIEKLRDTIYEAYVEQYFINRDIIASRSKKYISAESYIESKTSDVEQAVIEGFIDRIKTTISNMWKAFLQLLKALKDAIVRTYTIIKNKILAFFNSKRSTDDDGSPKMIYDEDPIMAVDNMNNDLDKLDTMLAKFKDFESSKKLTDSDMASFDNVYLKLNYSVIDDHVKIEGAELINTVPYELCENIILTDDYVKKFMSSVSYIEKRVVSVETTVRKLYKDCVKLDPDNKTFIDTYSELIRFFSRYITNVIYDRWETITKLVVKISKVVKV
jgi:hypothetical protein